MHYSILAISVSYAELNNTEAQGRKGTDCSMCSCNFLFNSFNSLLQASVFPSHNRDVSLMSLSLNSVSTYTQEIKTKTCPTLASVGKTFARINDTALLKHWDSLNAWRRWCSTTRQNIKYDFHTSIVRSSLAIFWRSICSFLTTSSSSVLLASAWKTGCLLSIFAFD